MASETVREMREIAGLERTTSGRISRLEIKDFARWADTLEAAENLAESKADALRVRDSQLDECREAGRKSRARVAELEEELGQVSRERDSMRQVLEWLEAASPGFMERTIDDMRGIT